MRASSGWPKSVAVVLAFAAMALIPACGRGPSQHARTARPSPPTRDTVRVEVAGRSLIVPAPEGMVEVLAAMGRAPTSRSGDRIAGMFVPRERAEDVLARRGGSDVTGMLVIPSANRL